MAELFQVGQRGWLKLTQPTGTVTNVGGVGEIDGEIPVWVRMDQHFPHLELSCSCGVGCGAIKPVV